MKYPIDKYMSLAATTFSDLFQIFKLATNGWQVGNVFDTLTDYVVRFPDAEPSRGAVVEAALERWGQIQGSMCWYDDYGWWGIASAKAFDDKYADIFGLHRNEFQGIATDCWNVMHTGKPNKPYSYKGGPMVWGNRDDGSQPGYFTAPGTWAVPRFSGGVWQYDMFKDERTNPLDCAPQSSNPSDPNGCLLGPFQNTVMNGLYFVLALRLRLQDKGTGTDEAAKTELAYLNDWFSLEADESLLWRFDDGTRLVRERVATYDYCDEKMSYPGVQGYHPKGAWCGDQGLILGGLLDHVLVESDPTAQTLAINIACGVLSNMVDDLGVSPYSSDFDDQGDPDDYSCGSGVFWRYLLRGFGQNAELRTKVLSLVSSDPENNAIYKSAEHVLSPRVPPNHNKLFVGFNILATLTAAIEILKEADG